MYDFSDLFLAIKNCLLPQKSKTQFEFTSGEESNGEEDDEKQKKVLNHTRSSNKGDSRLDRLARTKLRNSGQSYTTAKGIHIPQREMRDLNTCRLKCSERFTNDERKKYFEHYWNLGSRDRRAKFVANLISMVPKKTEQLELKKKARKHSYVYHLIKQQEKVRICKQCLCRTLGENNAFFNNVLRKLGSTSAFRKISLRDQRGRKKDKS